MKIKGVLAAIKKGGLIPYSKSIYRKKKKEIIKKLLENSKIKLIDINRQPQEINMELKKARTEFIAFYDKGAVFDDDYFITLRDVLKANPDICYATGRIIAKNGKPLAHFGKIEKDIYKYNVSEEVAGAPILIGAICRTHIIKNNLLEFNEELRYCKAELFATKYLEKSPKGLIVNGVSYTTGRGLDETSPKMEQSHNKEWYFATTRGYLANLINDGKLSKIAQFGFLYLSCTRFLSNKNENVKLVFESNEEREEYLAEVGAGMRLVSDKILFMRAPAIKLDRNLRRYFALLRQPDKELELEYKNTGTKGVIRLKDSKYGIVNEINGLHPLINTLEYRKEQGNLGLFIKFSLPDYLPWEECKFRFVNNYKGEPLEYKVEKTTELAAITTFFDKEVFRRDAYECFIPLKDVEAQEISLHLSIFGDEYSLKLFFEDNWQSKLEDKNEIKYWYFDGHIAKLNGNAVLITKADDEARWQAEDAYIKYIEDKFEKAVFGSKEKEELSLVLKWRKAYRKALPEMKNRRIWVYYDKSYKAGDNGEYAIKYAAAQDDGIEKVYYIEKSSKDGERLIKEGYKVVEPGSDEGAFYALFAEVIFMTHIPPFLKLGFKKNKLIYFRDLLNPKIIRMYHGYPITRSSSYAQMGSNAAAVVVASNYERELYTNEDNCFKDEQIIPSGNPRYDDLIDDSKNQVLIAPTWRPALVGKTAPNGKTEYNPKFKESSFYLLYNKVLTDEKLLTVARRKGYKIKLFFHPKFEAQTADFETTDVVEALSPTEDMDYVTIMKQSNLMVTDFSSVQYDFAYMRKPVVYYQDTLLPYWRITNFDYENIGFGEICRSADELIDILCDYIENDCKIKEEYKDRYESFFVQSDRQSAGRLYEAVRKLTEGEGK
nr:CDP-glycerol glycerophosphotransferase family protein [uncultured Catonella sp.]